MSAKPRYRLKASGEVVQLSDGFANAVSALGAFNEKVRSNEYVPNATAVSQLALTYAYNFSTWYQKILEIPADDATREWRGWKGTTSQIEKMEATEKRLKVTKKMHEAIVAARHRGGAVIYMGGLPGMSAAPLDLDRVRVGSLKFIHVLTPDTIWPGPIDTNPDSEYYGMPAVWTVRGSNGMEKRIHPSRVVVINGKTPPGEAGLTGEFWAQPIWSRLSDAIMNADGGAAILSAMMHESTVDVVKIKNFIQGLAASDAEDIHTKRWSMAKKLKSVGNVLMLDSEDEWDQKKFDWTGLPQVMNQLLTIMAGAADIPVTRVLGTSATGTNATGEGDLKNHYDNVRAMQKLVLTPALINFDEVLFRTTFGHAPKGMWYEWNSLWQPSDKEMAETDRLEANAAAIISGRNLVPHQALAEVVQNRMIESGRWPGMEAALKKHGTKVDPPSTNKIDPNNKQAGGNASGTENERAMRGQSINTVDATPRTMYISRNVLNAAEIRSWARSQGLKRALPDGELHVTIAYSRDPVDWMKVGESWSARLEIAEGGPRLIERFGKAVVLLFASQELKWRHEYTKELGASWDHPEFQPHITITYDEDVDIDLIEPYQGKIVLGPEIFSEVNENWSEGVKESDL